MAREIRVRTYEGVPLYLFIHVGRLNIRDSDDGYVRDHVFNRDAWERFKDAGDRLFREADHANG